MVLRMRSHLLVATLATLVVAGCSHSSRPVYPTTPVQYACGDTTVTRTGESVTVGEDARGKLSWHDDAGDHFLFYPGGTSIVVEVVTPNDPLADASRITYDVSRASSQSEWRQLGRTSCTVEGGYTDVLARYARGTSIDQLAVELNLADRDDARGRLRKAIQSVNHRYWHEH
jgi:hypothetical protein